MTNKNIQLKIQKLIFFIVSINFILVDNSQQAFCSNALLERLKAQSEPYIKDMVLKVSAHGKYEFCKQIWHQDGTCCDHDKLKSALPQLLDKWTEEVQEFVETINGLRSFFFKNRWTIVNRTIRMFEWAQDRIKKGNHKFTQQTISLIQRYLSPPKGFHTENKFDLDLLYLIQDQKRLAKLFDGYKVSAGKCHNKMKEFIGSMYCSICSAAAHKYMKDNKLRIHISTCREVVKECNDAWNLAYTLIHITNSYRVFSQALRLHLENKIVDIKYEHQGPDTVLNSGYISYLMREIDEVGDDYNVLFQMDSDSKLCNEVLMSHRGFEDTSGSKKIVDEFLSEYKATIDLKIPDVKGEKFRSAKDREEEFKVDTISTEEKVKNLLENQKNNIEEAEKSHQNFNKQMESEFIPKAYQYAKELSERQAAKDIEGEKAIIQKQDEIKKKFSDVLQEAVKKNQIVQDELKKYLHKVFSFPIEEGIKIQFVKSYQKNIVHLGYLKKVEFPNPKSILTSTMNNSSTAKTKLLALRILQGSTMSDLVYVSDLFGDNAKMIDTNNDVLPPVGVKKLDTSTINNNHQNLWKIIWAYYSIILFLIRFI